MERLLPFAAGVFLLYWPYVWCWYRRETLDSYGLIWRINRAAIIQTFALTLAVLAALTPLALLWPWDRLPHKQNINTVLNLLSSGLAAAVIEETFFRGWVHPVLRKKLSPIAAIFITNLIFAPAHLFAAPYFLSLLTFFPGLIMSWLREKYGNVFPSILFHFLGNVWSIWFFPAHF
jgi:membrane protease YdiL (CAAX protease family)